MKFFHWYSPGDCFCMVHNNKGTGDKNHAKGEGDKLFRLYLLRLCTIVFDVFLFARGKDWICRSKLFKDRSNCFYSFMLFSTRDRSNGKCFINNKNLENGTEFFCAIQVAVIVSWRNPDICSQQKFNLTFDCCFESITQFIPLHPQP